MINYVKQPETGSSMDRVHFLVLFPPAESLAGDLGLGIHEGRLGPNRRWRRQRPKATRGHRNRRGLMQKGGVEHGGWILPKSSTRSKQSWIDLGRFTDSSFYRILLHLYVAGCTEESLNQAIPIKYQRPHGRW